MTQLGHLSREDPSGRFDLTDRLGRGAYGDVYKVLIIFFQFLSY